MQLLLQLNITFSKGQNELKLGQALQRLWPFFRHPLASVRMAAVRLFAALVAAPIKPGVLKLAQHRTPHSSTCHVQRSALHVGEPGKLSATAGKDLEDPATVQSALRLVFNTMVTESDDNVRATCQVTPSL